MCCLHLPEHGWCRNDHHSSRSQWQCAPPPLEAGCPQNLQQKKRLKQWTASGKQQNQGCKRAAARLSMASADCAGTKELPSRGLPFRKASITSYVCMQMSLRCNTPLFAEQAVLEMPRKTNVSPALNSLSWPVFEDISTALQLSNEAVFKKKKKKKAP